MPRVDVIVYLTPGSKHLILIDFNSFELLLNHRNFIIMNKAKDLY